MVLNWAPVAVYPACSGLSSAVPVLAPAGPASPSPAAAAAPAAMSADARRQRRLLMDIDRPSSGWPERGRRDRPARETIRRSEPPDRAADTAEVAVAAEAEPGTRGKQGEPSPGRCADRDHRRHLRGHCCPGTGSAAA